MLEIIGLFLLVTIPWTYCIYKYLTYLNNQFNFIKDEE